MGFPVWGFPFSETTLSLSPISSLSPLTRATVLAGFTGRFLRRPATSDHETCPIFFSSSSSSTLYKFCRSNLAVGGEIKIEKSPKKPVGLPCSPAPIPAKSTGTTYWALKPPSRRIHCHRNRGKLSPEDGESNERKSGDPPAFEAISGHFRSEFDFVTGMKIVAGDMMMFVLNFGDHRRWLIRRRVGSMRSRL